MTNGENRTMAGIRHVVMFRFKDGATPERIQEVVSGFGALAHKIDGITGFEWGTNNSPEGKNNGLTHCFMLDFKDAAARDAYLPHHVHVAFANGLADVVADVCVFDYAPLKG
jgi:hypothetical protein